MRYYKVFVDNTNALFTYSDINDEYKIGERVKVRFQNKVVSAMIIIEDKIDNITFKVNPIIGHLAGEINLSEAYIKLLIWMADYYMCSFAALFRGIIPKGLKVRYNNYYTLADEDMLTMDSLDPVVNYFKDKAEVGKATLKGKFDKAIIKDMIDKGILVDSGNKIRFSFGMNKELKDNGQIFDDDHKDVIKYFVDKTKITLTMFKNSFPNEWEKLLKKKVIKEVNELAQKKVKYIEKDAVSCDLTDYHVVLNDEQEKAKNNILNSNKKYHLIHGITGSGKTEIYIEIIRDAFLKGKGSIFLVPEISLTPQLIARFKRTFGDNIAILHSHLTPSERSEEWYSLYSGEKKIVLGARSAVFAPVKDLKNIIIDEEHETTYKQDTNPRYHTRMVALKRGELEDLKIILGSATPSIESYYFAKKDIFNLEILSYRYNNSFLPEVKIIDMKNEEDIYFSKLLLKDIKNTLLKGEQVILFLNRKGYSTYIQCKDCGYVEECEHCSIKYSYYAGARVYKCNYCGSIKKYTGTCSKCGSKNLIHSGKGIERVEEEIKKYFDVPVISIDSDKSTDRNFYERVFKDFADKKYSIMIGTQVISKGLHFPNVTLVGVINGDTILNFPDFRACEKTFQILTQVSGRAGRGDKKGNVVVQTYDPENYTFKCVKNSDYEQFYQTEIQNRELLSYPPFSKTINIGISSTEEEHLEDFAKGLYNDIKYDKVEIYGPMKSLIYKVKDRYRYNIFVKGNRENVVLYKRYLREKLRKYEKETKYRIVVDIDPINLI